MPATLDEVVGGFDGLVIGDRAVTRWRQDRHLDIKRR
jgi:hypothetical protein